MPSLKASRLLAMTTAVGLAASATGCGPQPIETPRTSSPTAPATATSAAAAPSQTPADGLDPLREDPFAGPAPEGSLRRLGRGTVAGIAYSPDGRMLTVWGSLGVFHYDPETLELLRLDGAGLSVRDLVVSPDGLLMASISSGQVSLREMTSGKPTAPLEQPGNVRWDEAFALAFSPDGRHLASSSYGIINIWDVSTGDLVSTLEEPGVIGLSPLVFSPDGRLIAVGEGEDLVLLDVSNGHAAGTLEHAKNVTWAVFSPDGSLLASKSWQEGRIHLWDPVTGASVLSLPEDPYWDAGLSFSPDGRLLASGSPEGVTLWEAPSGEPVATFDGAAWSLAFSPDGDQLAVETREGVRIWDVSSRESRGVLNGHTASVSSLAFSPDGRLLATASTQVILWDVSSGAPWRFLPGPAEYATSVAFSPDGRLLASGAMDKTVHMWDVSTGDVVATLPHGGIVDGLSFSPDGELLAAEAEGGALHVWEVDSGTLAGTLNVRTTYDYEARFSPDGRFVVSGVSEDLGELFFWDALSLKPITAWQQIDIGHGMAFSPDSSLVAVGSSRQTVGLVAVYEVSSGQRVSTLEQGDHKTVKGLAFSPDGRLLAVGLNTGTVAVWDLSTGESPVVLEGHTGDVNAVTFSPDGRLLASASSDGTVVLWEISSWGE